MRELERISFLSYRMSARIYVYISKQFLSVFLLILCLLAVQMFIYYTVFAFLLKLEQLLVKNGICMYGILYMSRKTCEHLRVINISFLQKKSSTFKGIFFIYALQF
jgi:hypothetical protein